MNKKKRSKGRRTKLTPEIQRRIVTAIQAGNYAKVAAEYAGIHVTTFYRWMHKGSAAKSGAYRDFYEAVRKAEGEVEVRAVAILHKAMDNNWQAAFKFLERKFPERWGRRDHLSVDVNPRETLAEMLAVTPEELDEAVEAIARIR